MYNVYNFICIVGCDDTVLETCTVYAEAEVGQLHFRTPDGIFTVDNDADLENWCR